MKELIVEASIDNLNVVLDFVNEDLKLIDCSLILQSELEVIVEEIFMNISNHAYKPNSGNVAIYLSVGDEIVIRFEDTAKPYNPLEQADPVLDIPLTERKEGGLGVYLVKQLMDKVAYEYVNNKNILTVTKEIKKNKLKT
jgi:anti-sigma regulatory factor (Ser/Thr protein kinase)